MLETFHSLICWINIYLIALDTDFPLSVGDKLLDIFSPNICSVFHIVVIQWIFAEKINPFTCTQMSYWTSGYLMN